MDWTWHPFALSRHQVATFMDQQYAQVAGDPDGCHNWPPESAKQHEGGNYKNGPMYVDVDASYSQDGCEFAQSQGLG
jgi:hypothetical protein